MKKLALTLFFFTVYMNSVMSNIKEPIKFTPVQHASFIIHTGDLTIYVDPVGSLNQYSEFETPDIVIYTHEHSDHFDASLLDILRRDKTVIVAPKIITDKLGFGKQITNGDKLKVKNIEIEAVPMYNTSPDKLKYHKEGVGNGYVLTINNKRVYISGDTEDVPEILKLNNIDYAFICMNLPYTMSVEQAARTVLSIRPKIVFPYHYRSSKGEYEELFLKFKNLISVNPEIELQILKWY